MKKTNVIFLPLVCIGLASMNSCSCTDNRNTYPDKPVNGQVYRDTRGNESVWNTAMQCWMISTMMNGNRVEHHYYPSTGVYKEPSGRVISRPSYIPAPKSRFSTSSTSRSSNSKATMPSTTKPAAKSSGFGSTGRSSVSSGS